MFKIEMDISDLLKMQEHLIPEAEEMMRKSAQALTAATHGHIVEEVQSKLRSTRETYLRHLGFHQVNANTWVVDLMPGAYFIEDGLPSGFNMVPGLLDDSTRPGTVREPGAGQKSRTKTAKDGSRYRVIPFSHNKAQTRQTPYSRDLTDTIKSELKRRGMPSLGKIENDSTGKPKMGLVGKMDIRNAPNKTHIGPGQGHGAIGAARQGPTGIPFLQGVRIYQRERVDAQGKKSVQKTAMTFRVVSSKHQEQARWIHPGLEAKNFLEEAYNWALNEWESKIQPEIIKEFMGRL
jgi:hypothetical protein